MARNKKNVDINPLRVEGSSLLVNVSVAVSTNVLAVCAFILSFASLRDLAWRSGVAAEYAFLWPVTVDGFIVVASLSAFAMSPSGRKVTWYPWAALAVFSVVSISGNAMHAMTSPQVSVPVPVAAAVSAVPAIALLIASHLLVLMLSRGHKAVSSSSSPFKTVTVGGKPGLADPSHPPA